MSEGKLYKEARDITKNSETHLDKYLQVLDDAKADILDPVTNPAMNTGVPFLTVPMTKAEGDGVMVIDTRDAELKLSLLVRKIFKYFGEVAPRRAF